MRQEPSVQGFGKVGRDAAVFLDGAGVRVVAVSDQYGAIVNIRGLDLPALQAHVDDVGAVVGFLGGEPLPDREELLALDVDLLVPAAVEGVIRADNAARVRAQVVVEGANGPTTTVADEILNDRGVLVVPDILVNAGGVVVYYCEWVQANQAYWWSVDEVEMRLRERMCNAWERVRQCAAERNLSMRLAATSLAVETVADAHRARGSTRDLGDPRRSTDTFPSARGTATVALSGHRSAAWRVAHDHGARVEGVPSTQPGERRATPLTTGSVDMSSSAPIVSDLSGRARSSFDEDRSNARDRAGSVPGEKQTKANDEVVRRFRSDGEVLTVATVLRGLERVRRDLAISIRGNGGAFTGFTQLATDPQALVDLEPVAEIVLSAKATADCARHTVVEFVAAVLHLHGKSACAFASGSGVTIYPHATAPPRNQSQSLELVGVAS